MPPITNANNLLTTANDILQQLQQLPSLQKYTPAQFANVKQNIKYILNGNGAYGEEMFLLQNILQKYPTNTQLDIVALKICLVDVTHSTQIFKQKSRANILKIANAILSIKDFDVRVKQRDVKLVGELAKGIGAKMLSFASKYCQCHNFFAHRSDDYSKFDSLVCKLLPGILQDLKIPFAGTPKNFHNRLRDKLDYTSFDNYIDQVIAKLNLTQPCCPKAMLDLVLWQLAKV